MINEIVGPVNLFVCLLLLFFESAFGICIGCKIYEWAFRKSAQYRPGGATVSVPRKAKAPHQGGECEAFKTASLGEGGGLAVRLISGQRLEAR